jgi:hypothetical protein
MSICADGERTCRVIYSYLEQSATGAMISIDCHERLHDRCYGSAPDFSVDGDPITDIARQKIVFVTKGGRIIRKYPAATDAKQEP